MNTRWWSGALVAAGLFLSLGSLTPLTQAGEPKVGEAAPDFELQGTDGKVHKLSDYVGKKAIVIAWYPKAKTGG